MAGVVDLAPSSQRRSAIAAAARAAAQNARRRSGVERAALKRERIPRRVAEAVDIGGFDRAQIALGRDMQRDRRLHRAPEQRASARAPRISWRSSVSVASSAEQMSDIVEQRGGDQRRRRGGRLREQRALHGVFGLRHALAISVAAARRVERDDVVEVVSRVSIAAAASPSRMSRTTAVSARISALRRRSTWLRRKPWTS